MKIDIPNQIDTLTHITDVGAPSGDGADSTRRIKNQYYRLGVRTPEIISAGDAPLSVAFTAMTEVSQRAIEAAKAVREILGIEDPKILPLALNCAPRNGGSCPNAREDYMYRVTQPNSERLVLYGPEVLRWVLTFAGKIGTTVTQIRAIGEKGKVVPDTSEGSQFRSAEHLPLAHVLEACGQLDDNSEQEEIDQKDISDAFPDRERVVALPPDEFKNGRILVDRGLHQEIARRSRVSIPGLNGKTFNYYPSMTEAGSSTLCIWPSSNHFPGEEGKNLVVLNVGAKWDEGTTRVTNRDAIGLATFLSNNVGNSFDVCL